MTNNLYKILAKIAEEHKGNIDDDSRHYLEVGIAQKAAELGFPISEVHCRNAYAIVPLKFPVRGMKVRIDGRTFVNYAQFESGIVVPNHVARHVDLPHKAYVANSSMICNFTQS